MHYFRTHRKILGLICLTLLILVIGIAMFIDTLRSAATGRSETEIQNVLVMIPRGKSKKANAVRKELISINPPDKGSHCVPCKHRLPSALIIGVKKGGTGSLLVYLGLHPEIAIPDKQELR